MISDVEDLLIKIFLLLPTKTLVRFKLVCRHWETLISDHHFAHTHTVNDCHPKPGCFLLHRPKATRYYLLLHSLSGPKLVHCRFPAGIVTPTICNVSNGLFLLESPSSDYCHVYNPITRQSRRIPLALHGVYILRMGMTIAFDPLKSPYYKIVCMRATSNSGIMRDVLRGYQIEVYDSYTNTWRYYGDQFYVPVKFEFDRGVFWNGAVHWRDAAFDFNTFKEGNQHSLIRGGGDRSVVEHYVEVNGHLNCIAHFTERNLVEVFEWVDYDSNWIPKHRELLNGINGELSVLGMYWDDKEGYSKLVLHDNETRKVMTCVFDDLGEGVVKVKVLVGVKLKLFYEKCAQYDSCYSFQFLGNLACV